jgi:hypothetical protein
MAYITGIALQEYRMSAPAVLITPPKRAHHLLIAGNGINTRGLHVAKQHKTLASLYAVDFVLFFR